jgi:hypothetical protein
MLGATETSKGPEVAPAGIVMAMDVPLQVLIVTGAPFSRTVLPPCEAPKPEPEIATGLPIDPVVAETAVMTGAGAAVELTDTASKLAVARAEVFRLLAARPTYTFCAMLTVWLEPSGVQFTPSGEPYIANTFPVLASFIQYGSVKLEYDWYELLAPALVRTVVQRAEE